jgi:phospholipid/cholesterol/gamma-HCH transport system substrate-binding protein
MSRRHVTLILLATLLVPLVAGCGPDYSDLPLPGKSVSGDTYQLTAVFNDALNLAQGAQVKVNGVSVGRVQSVTADDFKAKVTMDIKTSTRIRRGSQARLRYDTPLGELFVQITPSGRGAALHNGDALDLKDTSTAPTVENALSAASLLVNGGGLEQLQTITQELNKTLGGREASLRSTLDRTNRFLASARASSHDIDALLHSLVAASKILSARRATLHRALREAAPIARMFRSHTGDVLRLLDAVDTLSGTATRVIGNTRAQLLQILEELAPIIGQVLATRSQLVPGLTNVIRAGSMLERTVPGDWLPLKTILKLDKTENPLPVGPNSGGGGSPGGPGLPGIPGVPGVPGAGGSGALPGVPGLSRMSFPTMVEGGAP